MLSLSPPSWLLRHVTRLALGLALVLGMPVWAAAQTPALQLQAPPPTPLREPSFTLRGGLGLGVSDLGIGGMFEADATKWLGHSLGVGALLGTSGAIKAPLSGTERSTVFFEPQLSLHFGSGPSYWVVSAGAGLAHVSEQDGPGLCINFGGGCGPTVRHSLWSVAGSLAAGRIFHLGSFAVAPMLRLDASPEGLVAVIAIELGGTVWRNAKP